MRYLDWKARPAALLTKVDPLALRSVGLWDGSRWSVLGACGRGFNPLHLHLNPMALRIVGAIRRAYPPAEAKGQG